MYTYFTSKRKTMFRYIKSNYRDILSSNRKDSIYKNLRDRRIKNTNSQYLITNYNETIKKATLTKKV